MPEHVPPAVPIVGEMVSCIIKVLEVPSAAKTKAEMHILEKVSRKSVLVEVVQGQHVVEVDVYLIGVLLAK